MKAKRSTDLAPRMASLLCLLAITSLLTDGFGRDQAPPSPEKPWYPPQLRAYETDLAHGGSDEKRNRAAVETDSEKVYELAELIDIAERTNPQTRIAWERARQAAAAV